MGLPSGSGSASTLPSLESALTEYFAASMSPVAAAAGRRPFRRAPSRYGELSSANYRPPASSWVLRRARQLEGDRAVSDRAPEGAEVVNGSETSAPAAVLPAESAEAGVAVSDLIRRFESDV